MRHSLWIGCLIATLLVASVVAATDSTDVENAALEYVRSSENYVSNGGFGETVLTIRKGENISVVAIEYQTECGAVFVAYPAVNMSTLDVIECKTEAVLTSEPVVTVTVTVDDPGHSGDPDDDDPDNSTGIKEAYRQKVSYMINLTMDLIRDNAGEGNFTKALSLLDEASTALDNGEYETALDLALKANEMVNDRIHGDEPSVTEPVTVHRDEPVTPWLDGYIVIFDQKPTDDDWDRLEIVFNATFAGEAAMYTPEPNAYWVKVSGVSPNDLKLLGGVKDVLVYKGAPDIARDDEETGGDSDVPTAGDVHEFLFLAFLAVSTLPVAQKLPRDK